MDLGRERGVTCHCVGVESSPIGMGLEKNGWRKEMTE